MPSVEQPQRLPSTTYRQDGAYLENFLAGVLTGVLTAEIVKWAKGWVKRP